MRRYRILVVGGGIAGMAFAIAARRRGHDVDLIEVDPRVVGVGIFLTGSTLSALESIGLAETCVAQGCPAESILYMDAEGNRLDEKFFVRVASPHLPRSAGITRRALARILGEGAARAGATVTLGITVDAIEDVPDGVVATLSDGTRSRYDLVVGADGIYSTVRRLVFGDEPQPVHARQGGWRFMTPRLPEVDRVFLYEANGLKAGLIPLDDEWMYELLTMPDPHRERVDEETAPARLHQLLEPFNAPILQKLRPQILTCDPARVMWRPFETLLLEEGWHRGRTVVIGDAAHSMTPHLSSGGGMAIEDAVILAECISVVDDLDAALPAFFDRRFERVRTIQGISRQICEEETSANPSRERIFELTTRGYQALGDPFVRQGAASVEAAA